ncbi:MAG: 50S ribosomal protein L3 N(5)-glutamine methyltransferase [Hyphomicrobiales bacterium]|uniref:50S ribosomal protein L3 N(5)-glutamine methyltransferase n=1 Tax=Rhabdaerophilum calidifontis TaxID=2604328 RepID=UPI00123C3CE6|nr:50S ribosomal protein L3 N(5)-glutamine methyltransferase [Rhabdaerophilum calidifontis]MCA1952457.1 50S ribosomal protein L3 N(5)-glutamine methyltransferase [Hyphomicrobiales bacterium]MCA1998392.1 50S ribosomal protein L3 N(5)-glutamine methyltransferase [Hyphomicrobiales bacterium]
MSEPLPPAAPRAEIAELVTLRDVLRYAVSAFAAAGLHHGHGATRALDEAAFLILESLSLPVDDFNAFADARLTAREKALLGERIARRIETRMPAAYITGRTWLRGFAFRADPRAIVPRSFIADLLASPLFDGTGGAAALVAAPDAVERVLDLCTGGGSLAILAAHAFPEAAIDAVELSPQAAALARENIADYGLEARIRLLEGDLYAPLGHETYDLILTNPPYVDRETMAMLPAEFRHEPEMALAGGEDGLDIVRRILAGAKARLRPGGGLLCEVGLGRPALEAAFPDTPFLWLDTEESEGEVFWLARPDLPG